MHSPRCNVRAGHLPAFVLLCVQPLRGADLVPAPRGLGRGQRHRGLPGRCVRGVRRTGLHEGKPYRNGSGELGGAKAAGCVRWPCGRLSMHKLALDPA